MIIIYIGKVIKMKLSKKQLLVVCNLVLLICATLPILTACKCKTVAEIKIENRTEQVLTIYYDYARRGLPRSLGSVEPGGYIYTPTFTMEDGYCQIDARNAEGEVVFSMEYDWWELRDMDREVVITLPEED